MRVRVDDGICDRRSDGEKSEKSETHEIDHVKTSFRRAVHRRTFFGNEIEGEREKCDENGENAGRDGEITRRVVVVVSIELKDAPKTPRAFAANERRDRPSEDDQSECLQ